MSLERNAIAPTMPRSYDTSCFASLIPRISVSLYIEITGNRLVVHAIDATGREFDQAVIERKAS